MADSTSQVLARGRGVMYRVLVVGNKRLIVEALVQLVASIGGWSAWMALVDLAPSADLPEGMELVVVDADAARRAPERVRALCDNWPEADVVLLTRHLRGDAAASIAGPRLIGEISYQSSPAAFLDALVQARDNRHIAVPTSVLATGDPVPEPLAGGLTSRQAEILVQLASGRRRGEIAESLGISPNTLRTHVQNIMARLDVHSQLELVTLARREASRDARLENAV